MFFGFCCTENSGVSGLCECCSVLCTQRCQLKRRFFLTLKIENWRITGIPTNKDEWASLRSWLVGGGSPLYVLFFNVNNHKPYIQLLYIYIHFRYLKCLVTYSDRYTYSGDSWMYPYQRTAMGNPYRSPIYTGYLWVIIPRIPREHNEYHGYSVRGTPILVPWTSQQQFSQSFFIFDHLR